MVFGNKAGAGRGIRTPDPLITNQMLYQLSYAGETFILPGALAWAQWRRRG
jgi:hypothetical protein